MLLLKSCRRHCRRHSLAPPLEGSGAGSEVGFDVEAAAPFPPLLFPVNASMSVLIARPRAVRILKIVTPCSRNNVCKRWASVVSPVRIRFIVSLILEICDLSTVEVVDVASSRASLSQSVDHVNFSLFQVSCHHPVIDSSI